jgi:L-threonylcarbamoyladenylate synthase
MEIVTINEFKQDREKFCYVIAKQSKVFIYPTDTIYGIGCNAEDDGAVERIRKIKERYTRPFSVIAPSKEWIFENCEINENQKEYIDKLPGPYTLVLPLKNKSSISPLVNNNLDTIGVRIPDHWISDFVSYFGKPVVTTSANKMGENFMTSIDDLDPRIGSKLDFVVYEGEKSGRPSKVIDLTMEDVEVIHR